MIRKTTISGYHAPAPRNRVSVYPLGATAGQKPATAHRNAVLEAQEPPGKIGCMTKRDVSHARARRLGFTLVELMVTVAIAAILAAVAAPQLSMFIKKQKVSADMDNFMTSLQLARSEALKRNGMVSICALSSATFTNSRNAACAASTGSDWSSGWMVYIDNSGGNGYASATDTVLKLERNIRSREISTSTATGTIISFQANGLTVSNPGTFSIKPSEATDSLCKQLVISRQGRLTKSSSCS